MSRLPAIDPELMYETWLACGRNQTKAAAKLGMPIATFGYHAKGRNFEGRYAADYSGAAVSAVKMANIEVMLRWPELTKVIIAMVLNEEETTKNRLMAYRELRESFPEMPQASEEERMTYVDARSVVITEVKDGEVSPVGEIEQQVMEQLEANILDVSDYRSRRGGERNGR